MSLLKNAKRFTGEYFLKKDMSTLHRKVSVSNFGTARSFGLLFDADKPEDYDLVKKYIKYLRDSKKKAHAIGFFDLKTLPQIEYSKLDYDFFTRKDLNWWGKPSGPFIKNFLDEEWDVLINFSLEDSFPLKYLAALSKAKMKIGPHTDSNEKLYDLMIQQPEGKNFKFFVRQVDHYLGIINKGASSNEKI